MLYLPSSPMRAAPAHPMNSSQGRSARSNVHAQQLVMQVPRVAAAALEIQSDYYQYEDTRMQSRSWWALMLLPQLGITCPPRERPAGASADRQSLVSDQTLLRNRNESPVRLDHQIHDIVMNAAPQCDLSSLSLWNRTSDRSTPFAPSCL